MQELRVCIESHVPDEEIKTAWFTLPIDEKDLWGKLGVDIESDDYRIVETILPFKADIKENTTIWRLNDLFCTFITLPQVMQRDCELLMEHFASLDLLHSRRDMIHFMRALSVCLMSQDKNDRIQCRYRRSHALHRYRKVCAVSGRKRTLCQSEYGIYQLP